MSAKSPSSATARSCAARRSFGTRSALVTTATADRSRTAAAPELSTVDDSDTTAAASTVDDPAATAFATASCSAVSASDGSATVAAAYVRPSPSRTAAPSTAPIRARADRARVTSLVSSVDSSGIGGLPLLDRGLLRRLAPVYQNGVDAVAPA